MPARPRHFLAALLLLSTAAGAAIFDDGNDRALLTGLRARQDPTPEERAIVAAAAKTGKILFCGFKFGGPAFLIRHNGRAAVVTSAHKLIGKDGKLGCGGSLDGYRDRMGYAPNTSWFDATMPDKDKAFVWRRTDIEFPPLNWDTFRSGIGDYDKGDGGRLRDFAVFYLKEDITRDVLPDGSTRGALEFAEEPIAPGAAFKVTMIGTGPDIGNHHAYLYQRDCNAVMRDGWFNFDCDIMVGASGSLLASFEDGKLKVRGIVTAGLSETLPGGMTAANGNIATSADRIREFLDTHSGQPN
jgi:hypothetical protein